MRISEPRRIGDIKFVSDWAASLLEGYSDRSHMLEIRTGRVRIGRGMRERIAWAQDIASTLDDNFWPQSSVCVSPLKGAQTGRYNGLSPLSVHENKNI
ncbi:unnamed protein product [Protopolystoma xenopodis]|uniref:Uncharacterized protein n=1 Tax=Protopolystoma xenopodis TaxID=117903 RepID=A0A448XB52_9PLAT|nr:unnamed protein product [Protopolystoma xenopodis]